MFASFQYASKNEFIWCAVYVCERDRESKAIANYWFILCWWFRWLVRRGAISIMQLPLHIHIHLHQQWKRDSSWEIELSKLQALFALLMNMHSIFHSLHSIKRKTEIEKGIKCFEQIEFIRKLLIQNLFEWRETKQNKIYIKRRANKHSAAK